MKISYGYIVFIFACVFGIYLLIRPAMRKHYMQSSYLEINPLNYLFLKPNGNDSHNGNIAMVLRQKDSLVCLLIQTHDNGPKINELRHDVERIKSYLPAKHMLDSVEIFAPEIVRVERMASKYIMNSPEKYHRHASGSLITESGKGADVEDLYVLRLTDGHIIKASPRKNAHWLGVKVGEKVRKQKRYILREKNWQSSIELDEYYEPMYE